MTALEPHSSAEVGGRCSEETVEFLAAFANGKAQASPFILQNRVKGACFRRWGAVLACSSVHSFLVGQAPPWLAGWGGDAPVHEVVRDDRFEQRHEESVGAP